MSASDGGAQSAVVKWLRSSTKPQAAVYRLAAFGAAAAYALVVGAGGVEHSGKGAFFFEEQSYYSVVAQVLPVLFLTFAVERRFFKSSRARASSVSALLAFGFVVLSAAAAELFSLAVIGIEDPSQNLRVWATEASAVGITGAVLLIAGQAAIDSELLTVLAEVIESPRDHFERERTFGEFSLLILGVPLAFAIVWGSYRANIYYTRQTVFACGAAMAILLWLSTAVVAGRAIAFGLRCAWDRLLVPLRRSGS